MANQLLLRILSLGHPEITGTHTIGAEYTEADRFDNPFYFYIDLPHAVTAKILWGDNNEFSTTKSIKRRSFS